jgi:ketosteroid isomerase-like protein
MSTTGLRSSAGAGRVSSSVTSSAPADLSDHVGLVKYLYEIFSAGDMDTIRSYCAPDMAAFEGVDEHTPQGTVHPSGFPFVRPCFGFDDMLANLAELTSQFEFNVKPLHFFSSPNTTDVVVSCESNFTGKRTGKKLTMKTLDYWTFNEKNQPLTLKTNYDPFMLKTIA